jgi:7,8-dihydropterin-6-yl-methyl-4-(beta-D-ribofuranosyl)aminobenzene 5'-phosphate synthase
MKKNKLLVILLLILFQSCGISGQDYKKLETNGGLSKISSESGIIKPVTVTVIYDNFVHTEGTKADWGYSILLEGLEEVILFDTGTKPDVFESNFRKIGIDPEEIDIMVISHEHGDHTGGISSFVKMKTGLPVIIPESFSGSFKKQMSAFGLKPVLVDKPSEICVNLFTTGEFDYSIAEQSLVLDTKKGLVVMTGCAHPGIIEMLKVIKKDFNKTIYMVFGGFHLMDKSQKEMDEIISEMKRLGVVKCGATHCTGKDQIEMFRKAFGEDYFELGVGNTIVIQ